MSGPRLDGAGLARRLSRELAERVARRRAERDRGPSLAIVWVKGPRELEHFGRRKARACERIGGSATLRALSPGVRGEDLESVLEALGAAPGFDGVLLQYPLPSGLSLEACTRTLRSEKDVDGMTAENRAKLAGGELSAAPATVRGLARLLTENRVAPSGRALVVGEGGPLIEGLIGWLGATGQTPGVIDAGDEGLEGAVRENRWVVGAAGRPGCISGSWLQSGAVAIDLGYLTEGGGDFALAGHEERLEAYVPARGGVGPMTTYEVLAAVVERWEKGASAKVDRGIPDRMFWET